MAQSLVKNYLHIVFGTKDREPLINLNLEADLYSYLGGICNNLNCQVLSIGGFTDHVHILCLLSKNIALAKLIEELKSHSSKWMKNHDQGINEFYWQNGYGAFSVNPSEIETVKQYISIQHEHHSKNSFQDEYRAFLKKYNVAYDERYVWK
jgi:putative transposase